MSKKDNKETDRMNKISVGDFEIVSSTESLKKVEACINRLIEKHKSFAEFRHFKIKKYGEFYG